MRRDLGVRTDGRGLRSLQAQIASAAAAEGQTLSPSLIAATLAMYAPSLGLKVDPSLIAATLNMFSPTITQWTPSNLSNVAAWIAGQGQNPTTGNIQTWSDQFPAVVGAQDVTQGTSGNRPLYDAGPSPYLLFDGGDSLAMAAADDAFKPLYTGTGGTFLCVFMPLGSSSTIGTIFSAGGASNAQAGYRARFRPSDGTLFMNASNGGGVGFIFNSTATSGVSIGSIHRLAYRYTHSISGDDWEIWLDGAKITGGESGVTPADVSPAAGASIGASLNMRLYASRVLNTRISDSDLTNWFNYSAVAYV